MVHADILDLKRVDLLTGLLVEEVLLHGIIDLFSGHLILEVATNGFVNFVHVGRDVLASEDGWCTKDTHGLATVVVRISRVSPSAWVESVVDGEVANFVVSSDGFTRSPFIILHLIGAVKIDEVVVKVVNGVGWMSIQGGRKELCRQGQPGVLSVN